MGPEVFSGEQEGWAHSPPGLLFPWDSRPPVANRGSSFCLCKAGTGSWHPHLTTCVASGIFREPPALSGLTQQGGGWTDNPEGLLPIGTLWDSAMI